MAQLGDAVGYAVVRKVRRGGKGCKREEEYSKEGK